MPVRPAPRRRTMSRTVQPLHRGAALRFLAPRGLASRNGCDGTSRRTDSCAATDAHTSCRCGRRQNRGMSASRRCTCSRCSVWHRSTCFVDRHAEILHGRLRATFRAETVELVGVRPAFVIGQQLAVPSSDFYAHRRSPQGAPARSSQRIEKATRLIVAARSIRLDRLRHHAMLSKHRPSRRPPYRSTVWTAITSAMTATTFSFISSGRTKRTQLA